ncbi:RluA family pseudouridine synthase [Collimonas fungivorans]|uniref:Pseudouridine synthase n=1 Tax=Collimonas fungivorans (strain Ter331) TaxID=1005048 RepID=G0ABN8_COLFT|nr:RluA family pseudouridine synthase [Collimonas fungivorans]AEK61604.1 Ribosomal large subunit pseudouridine synthase D [Collimonas fungivorans Ter331]
MGLQVMSFTKPNLAESLPDADLEADIDYVDDGVDDGDAATASAPIVLQLTPDVCGTRLDKVVSTLVPQYSRSRIQQWIEAGHVTVDGKPGTTKMTTYGDETVVVLPQPAPDEKAFTPEDMALDVVYEDAAIIVINKPAGLVVHPAAGNWSGTLLNGLLFRWPALAGVPRAGIVHRLDKDTSGLMVVAKTLEAQTDLVRQLQARTVKRQYLALVWGTPQLNGTVDSPMARHPRDRIKMAVSESLIAKPAITHYQRLATGLLERRPVSLMSCRLETGRTHQIRVHMQSLGFSLVGDALYGKQHLMPAFPRQALQASRLGLIHPSSGKACEWYAPLPEDFAALLVRAGMSVPE